MTLKSILRAALLGIALASSAQVATGQVLSVLRGETASNITVATNRAIIMASDRPFGELSVANPNIADIAPLGDSNIYVLGKVPGRTTLTLLSPEGALITNVDVRVVPDIAEFKERLAEILPGEPIEVRTAADGIVLSGTVSGARKVARAMELASRYSGSVTNLMMVGGTQQVMLKVRFAEMERNVTKALGSGVGISGLFGGGNTGDVQLGQSEAIGTGTATFSFGAGGATVDLVIDALETKGMIRTLAEPNLIAISGQPASFLAGGEIPYDGGDNGTAFKEYGINLSFEPTVIDGNLIRLAINTSVTDIDTSEGAPNRGTGESSSEPALKTRRAATSLEMRDGQSFAIAGLLKDDFSDNADQVPWLGDVPVLGALFRSSEFRRKQTELVVIVTAHLVVPTEGGALSMPTDHMRIPTEEELFMNGLVEGSKASQSASTKGLAVQGTYGYVME